MTNIVVHNTDTLVRFWASKSTAQKLVDYHNLHLGNKQKYRGRMRGQPWGGFAYHYHIDTDGTITQGRSVEFVGDSGTDYSMRGLLLVVLEGKFASKTRIKRSDLPKYEGAYTGTPRPVRNRPNEVEIDVIADTPTENQKKSLDALTAWLAQEYNIDPAKIKGHSELVATSCPGENLMSYLPTLKANAARMLRGRN